MKGRLVSAAACRLRDLDCNSVAVIPLKVVEVSDDE